MDRICHENVQERKTLMSEKIHSLKNIKNITDDMDYEQKICENQKIFSFPIADNVQVKRSRAEGPICRSEPGRAPIFLLPVRDPDKASVGRGAQRRCV